MNLNEQIQRMKSMMGLLIETTEKIFNESYLIDLPNTIKKNLWKFCENIQKQIEDGKVFKDNLLLATFSIPIDNNLKKIIQPNSDVAYYNIKDKIDAIANDLSNKRGIKIVYNKNLNAFTTENGYGLVRLFCRDGIKAANVIPQFQKQTRDGYIYSKGSLLLDKYGNPTNNESNIKFNIPDFTNALMGIDMNYIINNFSKIETKIQKFKFNNGKVYSGHDFTELLYEALEHEFTHIYDAELYLNQVSDYGKGDGKKYAGHNVEFPTLVNQLLSKINRMVIDKFEKGKWIEIFSRNKVCLVLQDIWSFFSGKKQDLEEETYDFLSGGIGSLPQKILVKTLIEMKNENPQNYNKFLENLLNTLKKSITHLNDVSVVFNNSDYVKKRGYNSLPPITFGNKFIRDKSNIITQIDLS